MVAQGPATCDPMHIRASKNLVINPSASFVYVSCGSSNRDEVHMAHKPELSTVQLSSLLQSGLTAGFWTPATS